MALELSSFTSSRFTHGSPGRDPSELHIELRVQVGGGETKRFLRNLNRRTARLERFALLVSVDSLRSLPASQDSPLGYRFLRSPLPYRTQSSADKLQS